MVLPQPHIHPWPEAGSRFAFLVSTTACARVLSQNLGSAAYSYAFVLEALAPVLEQLGTWRLIDQPASSLPHAAARARAEGLRPVHLAIHPLQDCYFSASVPTIVFPFWEFPDLPDRDFGYDTRQNWVRTARGADLILTACQFTADAFARSGVQAPVAVVPVPLRPDFFDLPDWDAQHSWTTTCRHEVWAGESLDSSVAEETPPTARQSLSMTRRLWRRVEPRLDPTTVQRAVLTKRRLVSLVGKPPAKIAFLVARAAYRRGLKPWLSELALDRIGRVKLAGLRLAGKSPMVVVDPLLPAQPLTLSGLVYTSIFNLGDPRKNYLDALTAFLLAFRDRPDVTLVLKLVTSPYREHHEVSILRAQYRALGLSHRCRLVVLTDYLNEDQMSGLLRATTYYVNTSLAEGACLPLQRALAGGRPAIAPAHTAMADYMDESLGFVPRSHPEPTCWPHDPDRRLETYRYRLVWSDLREMFLASAAIATTDLTRYHLMATAARRRMAEFASRPIAAAALRRALAMLGDDANTPHVSPSPQNWK